MIYKYIIILCISSFIKLLSQDIDTYLPIDTEKPITFIVELTQDKIGNAFEPNNEIKVLMDKWCSMHGYLKKYKNINYPENKCVYYFIEDESHVDKFPNVIEFKFDKDKLLIQNRGTAFNGKYSGHCDKLSRDVANYLIESLQNKK